MPFFEPFKESFQPNDLVYGISEVRDDYAEKYACFKKSQTPYNISTIDQYIATSKQRNLSDVYYKDRPKPENLDSFLETLKEHHKYNSAYYSEQGY